MLCPVCEVEMLVLEFELIELDHCAECGGVWLDSGELTLLADRAGAVKGDLLAALEGREGTRPQERPKSRCPVCRGRLARVRTPGEKGIVLDKCPRGDGLWFDRGELQSVITAAGGPKDGSFIRFLAEIDGQRSKAAR